MPLYLNELICLVFLCDADLEGQMLRRYFKNTIGWFFNVWFYKLKRHMIVM